MAKEESSTHKSGNSKGQDRKGHQYGDRSSPKSWQPFIDRTTKPPKGSDEKK